MCVFNHLQSMFIKIVNYEDEEMFIVDHKKEISYLFTTFLSNIDIQDD